MIFLSCAETIFIEIFEHIKIEDHVNHDLRFSFN